MWKVPNLTVLMIVLVAGAVLALGLGAEETAKIVVMPTEGGAVVAQAERNEEALADLSELPADPKRRFNYLSTPRGQELAAPCLALAGEGMDNSCDTGRQLSTMEPCLAVKDCEALKVWEEQVGEPRLRSASRFQTTSRLPQDQK